MFARLKDGALINTARIISITPFVGNDLSGHDRILVSRIQLERGETIAIDAEELKTVIACIEKTAGIL